MKRDGFPQEQGSVGIDESAATPASREGHVHSRARREGSEEQSVSLEYLREREDQILGLPTGTCRKGDLFGAMAV